MITGWKKGTGRKKTCQTWSEASLPPVHLQSIAAPFNVGCPEGSSFLVLPSTALASAGGGLQVIIVIHAVLGNGHSNHRPTWPWLKSTLVHVGKMNHPLREPGFLARSVKRMFKRNAVLDTL